MRPPPRGDTSDPPFLAAPATEDGHLVRECLQGNQTAWRELLERYSRMVLAIPRHYGLSPSDSDDVFQNVFAALIDQLPRLQNHQGLAKWLITTTHRTVWRQFRRRGHDVPLDGHDLPTDDAPADHALRWEQQHCVRQALRRLGGRCEQLLTALYLDQPTEGYDQIAGRLGIPRGSIGPTRSRCLAKLYTLLQGERP